MSLEQNFLVDLGKLLEKHNAILEVEVKNFTASLRFDIKDFSVCNTIVEDIFYREITADDIAKLLKD